MSEEGSGLRSLLGGADDESKSSRSAAWAQIAFERMSLFTAIFGFALLLIKMIRVSHLNSRTAHALVASVGPMEVILGTFVAHFPSILFVISLLVTWWAVGSYASLRSITTGHVAAMVTIMFALLLLPWPFVVVLTIVGLVRYLHRSGRPEQKGRRTGYYLLVAAAAILLIADAEPWLPPETFSLSQGEDVLGYVLEEAETSTGWAVILVHDDRSVVNIPEESIDSREPCHFPSEHNEFEDFPSLLQVVISESTDLPEPECPDTG